MWSSLRTLFNLFLATLYHRRSRARSQPRFGDGSGARTLGSGCDVTLLLRGESQGPLCLGCPRPGPQKTTRLWGGKDGAGSLGVGSFRVGTHVLAAEAGPTTRAAALTLPWGRSRGRGARSSKPDEFGRGSWRGGKMPGPSEPGENKSLGRFPPLLPGLALPPQWPARPHRASAPPRDRASL